MRPPIYQPNGAAREYGEFALNIYDGCPHRCPYCYVPFAMHKDRAAFHAHCAPRPGIVEETRKQLEKTGMTGKTIFLCFSCDPFPTGYDCTPTLDIIRLLKEHGNHVQILTKGDGTPCLDLLDANDWYGITLDGSETTYGRRLQPCENRETELHEAARPCQLGRILARSGKAVSGYGDGLLHQGQLAEGDGAQWLNG